MGCAACTNYRNKNINLIRSEEELKVDPSSFIHENKQKFQEIYRMAQNLGSGTYGDVRICFHRQTNQKRAVKLFRKDLLLSDSEKLQLLREVSLLKTLNHPNIIRTFEFFEDQNRFYLIMEYCVGGELFTEILRRQSYSENDAASIFSQILSAVSYLHSKNIVHGDLNPENILLEDKGDSFFLKIADFGSALLKSEIKNKTLRVGNPYYVAPEIYEGICSEKSDLWSCGVILYILLCGHPPFDGENDEQIISFVKRMKVSMEGIIWEKISENAKKLIRNLICSLKNRLDAQTALKHPWILENMKKHTKTEDLKLVVNNLKSFHAPNKLKDAVLTYITTQNLNFKDTKQLRKIFMAIDRDGDGQISKADLVNHFCGNLEFAEAEREAERIFEQVDSDKNGFIDYTEFLRVNIDVDKIMSDQNLDMAFSLFDQDGSGKISVEEVKKMFCSEGVTDNKFWKEFVKAIDCNGDGEIDVEEFKNYIKNSVV